MVSLKSFLCKTNLIRAHHEHIEAQQNSWSEGCHTGGMAENVTHHVGGGGALCSARSGSHE